MLSQIRGLHHVTSIASGAMANNDFFTRVLGLRRVKTTVNFDNPAVYHLYYGDELGRPGTAMTYFPFAGRDRGQRGTGEVSVTAFTIPPGSADAWQARLENEGVQAIGLCTLFGETRLGFDGPDGERLALVEAGDERPPFTGAGIGTEMAIRGFHSVTLCLAETAPTEDLLAFMGYERAAEDAGVIRWKVAPGTGANAIDIVSRPDIAHAIEGAGSVHHIAFSVANRSRQLEVREALIDAGYEVTGVRDRTYFHAIYFKSPGGILFEVATDEPGFATDETADQLGQALRLPPQHEHLREELLSVLEPLG
ncbi:MAG: VOC family protein [Brevirhabdus sp.]